MLIIQAGDIQIQPGPTYIKYLCGICSKNVNWNAKALQCDGCDIWYHTKCSNVGLHDINVINIKQKQMFSSGLIISDCAILLPGAVKGFEVWNFAKLCARPNIYKVSVWNM
jgi:hypothetical protein